MWYYHRLRQQGLHDLSVLSHDSQAEKQEFIYDLKAGYEGAQAYRDAALRYQERKDCVDLMNRHLAPIRAFSDAMSGTSDEIGIPVHRLVQRLVQLQPGPVPLSDLDNELVPPYGDWIISEQTIARLSDTLIHLGKPPIFALHPLRLLKSDIIDSDRPLAKVQLGLTEARSALETLGKAAVGASISLSEWNNLPLLIELIRYAESIRHLSDRNLASLLDEKSNLSKHLRGLMGKP